eukprot:65582-Rhodomonas_salina.5
MPSSKAALPLQRRVERSAEGLERSLGSLGLIAHSSYQHKRKQSTVVYQICRKDHRELGSRVEVRPVQPYREESGVSGLGSMDRCLRSWVDWLESRVQGPGSRVQGLGSREQEQGSGLGAGPRAKGELLWAKAEGSVSAVEIVVERPGASCERRGARGKKRDSTSVWSLGSGFYGRQSRVWGKGVRGTVECGVEGQGSDTGTGKGPGSRVQGSGCSVVKLLVGSRACQAGSGIVEVLRGIGSGSFWAWVKGQGSRVEGRGGPRAEGRGPRVEARVEGRGSRVRVEGRGSRVNRIWGPRSKIELTLERVRVGATWTRRFQPDPEDQAVRVTNMSCATPVNASSQAMLCHSRSRFRLARRRRQCVVGIPSQACRSTARTSPTAARAGVPILMAGRGRELCDRAAGGVGGCRPDAGTSATPSQLRNAFAQRLLCVGSDMGHVATRWGCLIRRPRRSGAQCTMRCVRMRMGPRLSPSS